VCSPKNERDAIVTPIVTQRTMNNGVTINSGWVGWTDVNLQYKNVPKVKMVLVTKFTDRTSLKNYMSLSFADTDDGIVGRMHNSGISKHNLFSVFISEK